MDPLAIAKSLLDLGGWGAFVVVVVVIGIGGVRRWWTFGWVFDREAKGHDTADTQAERNAESIRSLTDSFAVMARSYDKLEQRVDRLASGRVKND